MSIIERVRASGKCPPSLLSSNDSAEDGFETAVSKVVDATGTAKVAYLLLLFCFDF